MKAKTRRIFATIVASIVAIMMLVTTIIWCFPNWGY